MQWGGGFSLTWGKEDPRTPLSSLPEWSDRKKGLLGIGQQRVKDARREFWRVERVGEKEWGDGRRSKRFPFEAAQKSLAIRENLGIQM